MMPSHDPLYMGWFFATLFSFWGMTSIRTPINKIPLRRMRICTGLIAVNAVVCVATGVYLGY